jgi:TRAP-type C4-dicarboxylate transport system substrate-binding protein
LWKEWINEVDKGTGGSVKVTRYDAGVLSPMAQVYDSVIRGIVDMGATDLAYTPGRFPFMEIARVPLGGKDAYTMGHLANELYKKFKPKEFDDVKVLYLYTNPPYWVHSRSKPIQKLEDFKGLKVRTTGGTADVVKLLGGTPVAMPVSEVYDALSRGVVDANWMSNEALVAFRFADVVKYSTWCLASTNIGIFICAMNKDKWNSMSPKQQKVVEEATSKLTEKYMREWDAQEKKAEEWAKKEKGVQFIVLPEEEQKRWGEKVKPMADEYVQKMKKLGIPGDEAIKFAMDYLKKQQ